MACYRTERFTPNNVTRKGMRWILGLAKWNGLGLPCIQGGDGLSCYGLLTAMGCDWQVSTDDRVGMLLAFGMGRGNRFEDKK